ncbi:MAG: ATP-binding protein, partial [Phenylobacterium sp.]|uniref:hybrid sensor histidine kinase/response regulator n=1 Tax=Phenylobacterium sp. TaxID=1871053 RepID=UPI002736F27A
QYNQWVADQTLEDYALRFTAETGRRWPVSRVANTALGSIAFLACEAIGAAVALNYGMTNTVWALAAVAVVVVLTGLPICYYAARYGVDMDLLTRGSGFGYLGSTITSAIYASFTFILFAIEAAILSTALQLCFGIPLGLGHVISALVVIPIAAYGVRRISWLQGWTQPIWLVLQAAPLVFIVLKAGDGTPILPAPSAGQAFDPVLIGAAAAIILSLLPQIGEQVDYLRFMPPRTDENRGRWWAALLFTGPGWILVGGVKILLGAVLAYMALDAGRSPDEAAAPAQMYAMVFGDLLGSPAAALVVTGLFVAVCQVKINVTNGYAGSIAASNFFSRLTHRHPGRVVWLVFNVLIASMLMQFGILEVVERILTLYSNFAVAWIGAVTADLVINKPLGLSPKGIEFKRAYLYDINPVGVGAMLVSLIASSASFFGLFGEAARTFSPMVGLLAAFVAAPAIAWATRGRYYLARPKEVLEEAVLTCVVCENRFERPDMALCPVYQGPICSLCCTLDARCHDACKTDGRIVDQTASVLRRILPAALPHDAYRLVARFLGVITLVALILGTLLGSIYLRQADRPESPGALGETLGLVFAGLLALGAFAAWFFVLAGASQRAAEEESDRQTAMLMDEIEAHQRTDAELERAKEAAESANLAKSRYIVGVSHEIRAPLNAISGYAQLLERNPGLNARDAVRVIRRSATHLADLVDGLLDISRIENGTLRIERERINLHDLLNQIVDMFRLQAAAKGIVFRNDWPDHLPVWVYTDQKRLRQILINLLSNAIKYTQVGEAVFKVRWRGEVAEFEISDTGVGFAESDFERIFEPFQRLQTEQTAAAPGVGLGLTITKLLTTILGGEISVDSRPGVGSTFKVRLMLYEAARPSADSGRGRRIAGFAGERRRILVTDDDPTHLDLIRELLQPLGFDLAFASSGLSALASAVAFAPDLVIMDVSMPGIDGWVTAQRLRTELGEAVAILMVSANAHDFSRTRREDDPHDDFLIKPYEVDDLLERIQVLLSLQWRYAGADAGLSA